MKEDRAYPSSPTGRIVGIVGFGCYWAWLYLGLYTNYLTASQQLTGLLYFLSISGAVVLFAIVGLFRIDEKVLSVGRIASAIGLTSATALCTASTYIGDAGFVVFAVSAFATGLFSAMLLLSWGYVHCGFDAKEVSVHASFSIAFASFVSVLFIQVTSILGIPSYVNALLPISLPLLSLWCLRRFTRQRSLEFREAEERQGEGVRLVDRSRLPLSPLLIGAIFIFGLAFGLMNSIIGTGPDGTTGAYFSPISMVLGGTIAAVIGVGTLVLMDSFDFGFAYKPILLIVAAGFCVLPLLDPDQGYIAASITSAGYVCFDIFIWITLTTTGRNMSAQDKLATLALGRLVCSASVMIGALIGEFAFQYVDLSETKFTSISLSVVYLFILFGVVSLDKHSIPFALGLQRDEAAKVVQEHEFDSTCVALAQRYGLSTREREIMILMAHGRGIPYIADTLYIAESTVRTHAKHIYRKLNIHSREELISLSFGNEPSGEEGPGGSTLT